MREVPLPPAEVFARLTDWERHGEVVPLTTITPREGGFLARTGVGRVGFDDPMDVVEWDPPRHVRLVKRGRVVLGWAELRVVPVERGSRVEWEEEAHVRGVPRFLGRLEERAGRVLFGRVIDHVLRA